jgi:type II restriction enzyme
VDLRLPIEEAQSYKSLSQRARVTTETWAERNAFCVACTSEHLHRTRSNSEVFDFNCTQCGAAYELKASRRPFSNRIVDAGFEAMLRAIRQDRLPHFFVLRYGPEVVRDLMLIPSFALSASAIEPRRPLSATARRAGWVGCNILTSNVPPECRIPIVESGCQVSMQAVRLKFSASSNLAQLAPRTRSWTLDVLAGLRSLGREVFALEEAYGLEDHLASLHPQNRNIRPKIRQQLQILRDLGYLKFLERGIYEFVRNR